MSSTASSSASPDPPGVCDRLTGVVLLLLGRRFLRGCKSSNRYTTLQRRGFGDVGRFILQFVVTAVGQRWPSKRLDTTKATVEENGRNSGECLGHDELLGAGLSKCQRRSEQGPTAGLKARGCTYKRHRKSDLVVSRRTSHASRGSVEVVVADQIEVM